MSRRLGLAVNVSGFLVSAIGILLLFSHVTTEYNSHIQDVGSIALGYLGLILLGVVISITGIGITIRSWKIEHS